MKKCVLALLCALSILLSACEKKENPPAEGDYKIYFAVSGERGGKVAVDFEHQALDPGEDPVEGLVKRLLAGPKTAGLASPLLSGVRLRSVRLEQDGQLYLDLSEQYNGLPGVYLTVANACFVLTLTQVEGVETVYITVEGTALPYQAIQALRADDFLLSGAEEEIISVGAFLYFPREEGSGLGAEYRTVTKTESDSLSAAVMSALLEGPGSEGLVSPLPEGTTLRSVRVEKDICKVDLSKEFLQGEPQETERARLAVYSIVNTLCALEELNISSVQVFAEGAPVSRYGGLPTLAPLEPDYSLVKENSVQE